MESGIIAATAAKKVPSFMFMYVSKVVSGKPWRYVLIPHDEIAESITLEGLAAQFGC